MMHFIGVGGGDAIAEGKRSKTAQNKENDRLTGKKTRWSEKRCIRRYQPSCGRNAEEKMNSTNAQQLYVGNGNNISFVRRQKEKSVENVGIKRRTVSYSKYQISDYTSNIKINFHSSILVASLINISFFFKVSLKAHLGQSPSLCIASINSCLIDRKGTHWLLPL